MSEHDAVVVPFDELPRLPSSGLRHSWDDRLDGFYLQCSSQWDGLRHIGGPDGWYGGWHGRADTDTSILGIQHWAERGIIGRGVLIDLAGSQGSGESRYDPFRSRRPRAVVPSCSRAAAAGRSTASGTGTRCARGTATRSA